MKIVFFGTPDYVLPILESLHKTFRTRTGGSPIIAVVTQKPRPVGRKKILTYSAIDSWAHKKKVPVYYRTRDLVKKKLETDIGVLAAYGQIIPKFVISHLSFDILNIHPSLLPEFRGASPIQATIVSGKKVTGATIMKIDEDVDHGPIISQFKEEVRGNDTTEVLRKRLFEKSAEVLTTLLPAYLKGKIKLRQQDHKKATFTTLLKKQHGFIPPEYLRVALKGEKAKGEWKIPFIKNYTLNPNPYTLDLFIRAMQPWPIAWTNIKLKIKSEKLKVKRLIILRAHLEPISANSCLAGRQARAPKEDKTSRSDAQRAAQIRNNSHLTDNVQLVLDLVQLEGKNPVSWKQFKETYANAEFK